MGQVQKTRRIDRQEPVAEESPTPAAKADHSITDDLLDEIDAVLEENAQEFVSSYIQRGGQ